VIKLNSRERIQCVLNHEKPDRIPLDLGSIATTLETKACYELMDHLNLNSKKNTLKVFRADHVDLNYFTEILNRFNIDTRYVHFSKPERPSNEKCHVDEWGIEWCKTGKYYDVRTPTFETAKMDLLDDFQWPYDLGKSELDRWESEADNFYKNTEKAVIANAIGLGIFEQATWMRGIEEFYKDLYENPDFASSLLDKVLETQITIFDRFIAAIGEYVEAFWVLDDLGHQKGLLVAPGKYRELIKPRQERLYSYIKKHTDSKLIMHSDGAIRPLIGDLIEIGIDVLNPVQFSASGMDVKGLLNDYGEDLSFWGAGCDTQKTLPFGSVADVKKEVRNQLNSFHKEGNLVFSTVHNIQPGTPPENIVAMLNEALNYKS